MDDTKGEGAVMLSDHAKELIAKLELEYCPVAVKFSYNRPVGYERCEDSKPLCCYMKDVQDTGRSYYVDVADEGCMGKAVLGKQPAAPLFESGIIGFEHGFFRTPACNARLYYDIPMLKEGVCNYVTFAPVAQCTFDPDLVIFVAPTEKAAKILRASSWVNGDLYESKSSIALSCGWLYTYPYISGKINFCITGVHFGMKKMKLYPAGLHIITVPYQKIDNLITGFDEMDWDLIPLLEDEESKAISEASDKKVFSMMNAEDAFDFNEKTRHA